MTALTRSVLREGDLELVRRVTALTRSARVERVIGRGLLVTAAARPRDDGLRGTSWMHGVASQTAADASALRVVGVNFPVTILASSRGALSNIVRFVTARAQPVVRHFRLREHH